MEGLGLRFIDGRSAVGAVDWHDEVAVQGARGRTDNCHRPAVDSPASYGTGTGCSHVNNADQVLRSQ
jgi:hypothetical protein